MKVIAQLSNECFREKVLNNFRENSPSYPSLGHRMRIEPHTEALQTYQELRKCGDLLQMSLPDTQAPKLFLFDLSHLPNSEGGVEEGSKKQLPNGCFLLRVTVINSFLIEKFSPQALS